MNAFSGYNQIWVAEEDEKKTTFVMERDLYCSNMMPFGLKKIGAIHQHLVNKIFKNQIRRNINIYVDNMLIKNTKANHHIADLKDEIKWYQMKFNPNKCTLNIIFEKFLNFMVTRREIEGNPIKIREFLKMKHS